MGQLEDFQKQVESLADDLAAMKVAAVFGAHGLLFIDLYKLMIEKGLLTKEELSLRLATLEVLAAANQATAPLLAQHTFDATLSIRNAFGLVSTTKN